MNNAKQEISELFVRHGMHTNQALINELEKKFSNRQQLVKEIRCEIVKKMIPIKNDYDHGYLDCINDILALPELREE